MEALLVVALGLFAITHIDTLLVVIAFCLDEDYATSEVLIGYIVGFLVGLAVTVLGAFVVTGVLGRWAFLLGAVPLSMGLWGLVRRTPDLEGDELQVLPGALGRILVVTVTAIGLYGENVAVYIPFFAGLPVEELIAVVVVYTLATGGLFLGAFVIARLTGDLGNTAWIDRWLVPTVLVLVGTYVLLSGWIVL